MAKTKDQKIKIYNNYKETLGSYHTVVMLDMKGIKTQDINILKNKLAEVDSKYMLIKNTLFKKALKEANKEIDLIEGATGAVFAKDEPVEALKKIYEFINEKKVSSVKIGIIEGQTVPSDKVLEISKLPAKPEMIAKLIGAIKSPLYSIVNVLNGKQKEFVMTLKAIEATK